MENSLERISNRFELAEELVNLKIAQYTLFSLREEKRIKKHKQNLIDLWDIIRHTNIQIMVVPDGEEREIKGQKENL